MALLKKSSLPDPPTTPPSGATRGEALQQVLRTGSTGQKREAVQALLKHPQASAVLVSHLAQETDVSVRESIFAGLLAIGDDTAMAGLVACLRSEDAGLRNQTIETLKYMPQRIGPLLEDLLQDQDPDVRIFTVNILESLQYPLVEELLIKVITQDPHVNVCATAVDLLGEVGDKQAETALLALKQRFPGEPYIQFAADLALKRINEA